jgi:hypothetical protein
VWWNPPAAADGPLTQKSHLPALPCGSAYPSGITAIP